MDSSSLIFIFDGRQRISGRAFTSLHRVKRMSGTRTSSRVYEESFSNRSRRREGGAEKGEYIFGNLHKVGNSFHLDGDSSGIVTAVRYLLGSEV